MPTLFNKLSENVLIVVVQAVVLQVHDSVHKRHHELDNNNGVREKLSKMCRQLAVQETASGKMTAL